MKSGFTVSVRAPDGANQRIHVAETEALHIGRDPSCHVVLPSQAVSRFHLRVEMRPGGPRAIDCSSNGTVLDGKPMGAEGCDLLGTGEAEIGPYLLRIRATEAPSDDPVSPALKRRIHRSLLDHLDLASLDASEMDADALRPRVIEALFRIVAELAPASRADELVAEMTDEVLGLGPLQDLLEDDTVSEIMVVDPATIYVERRGKITLTPLHFMDDESCRAAIERIVTPLGRRIDESTPLVDARLKDGSRVNAIIPPLAVRGPCITIRKFSRDRLSMAQLIESGSLNESMAMFLRRCVRARKNVVISGGTGSGKTTLLNVLSTEISADERIVTIEDAAELRLNQPHVVSLEAKPRNLEGTGGFTIRDLVKNALRMRPDRIIVGECRAGEAIDMLQAMNTGHEGSMTTTHANSSEEAIKRIETLCLMSGLDVSPRTVREQIACSVHVVIQQTRFSDGSRRLTAVTEVGRLGEDGELVLRDVFIFRRTGTGPSGEVLGEHRATGYVPTFLDEFIAQGLVQGGEYL